MPLSSSSLASAPRCIIWLNVICRVLCNLSVYYYILCYIIYVLCHCCVTNFHKLSGLNETHLLTHRSLLRASRGWNPGADQLHPHLGLGLLFWGHFSVLADFSSYFSPADFSCRTEVPVALLGWRPGAILSFQGPPTFLAMCPSSSSKPTRENLTCAESFAGFKSPTSSDLCSQI